ncbi:hypothetical protein Hrubri_0277 [Herbaspirillum rubrisubalbicans M1]|nr:hypothetical protein Hrubri_0277 [Herbaspirillum rubrisubalbicans M1]
MIRYQFWNNTGTKKVRCNQYPGLNNDNQLQRHMGKNKRPADIYLRFLQLAEALRGLPALPTLDPLEDRILAFIARAGQEQQRLSVRDLMAQSEFGSPAMLHARIKSMREKGWIVLADTEDPRRKQVELSQAAWLHFDKLSKCLVQATRDK